MVSNIAANVSIDIEDAPLFLNFIDLDKVFYSSPNAILLNKIDYSNIDYVKLRNSQVYARGGELNFIAHCDCDNLVGNQYIDIRCDICGTVVKDDFTAEGPIEHTAWLGMPESIKGVLHPTIYLVLANWLGGRKNSTFMDIVCDINLEIPLKYKYAHLIKGRGHNYFYENFHTLIDQLLIMEQNENKRDSIRYLIDTYKDILFCTKLPVLSSTLHSITSTDNSGEGRQYADASSQVILDAATDLATLESKLGRSRPNAISNVVQRVYKSYIGYISEITSVRLSKKKSLFRRHMLGSRFHLSARTVCIPHSGRYDEIYLPWSLAVNLLKIHIIGRLMQSSNMWLGEAMEIQIRALTKYDPVVHQIIKDLIAESPFPGIAILVNRNPNCNSI